MSTLLQVYNAAQAILNKYGVTVSTHPYTTTGTGYELEVNFNISIGIGDKLYQKVDIVLFYYKERTDLDTVLSVEQSTVKEALLMFEEKAIKNFTKNKTENLTY